MHSPTVVDTIVGLLVRLFVRMQCLTTFSSHILAEVVESVRARPKPNLVICKEPLLLKIKNLAAYIIGYCTATVSATVWLLYGYCTATVNVCVISDSGAISLIFIFGQPTNLK